VLTLLEELVEKDAPKYQTFWNTFGRVLKEGVPEDHANRDRLATLLRFSSTHGADDAQTVSLADYAGRMKDGQAAIYYITADGYAAARNSPHLEIFRKLGVEVLLLHERVDEWVASSLHEFDGKPLQSAAAKDLDLSAIGGDAPAADDSAPAGEHVLLLERLQSALKDRAGSVRVTHRLTDSPACLVSGAEGLSTNLERMLKAAGQPVPASQPILEVNTTHPIVRRLADESDPVRFHDWSQILFDQATLAEGGQIEEPAAFVKRLNALLLSLAGDGASGDKTP
jgi:molecular chaperone HtpG